MHILHITSHLNVGGISSYVLTLASAMQRRGHQVAVASGGGELESMLSFHGVPHWHVPLHTSVEFSPQVASATRSLAMRLREEPAEVLHAHTRVGQVVADRLSRRLGIPYVTTWHGFFRRNLGRRLWPCTGALTIAISEPVRQHVIQDFALPAERVRLIPHGIDATPFEAPVDARAQAALRAQTGVPADAPVVGTVARLVASKGVDQLIRSFSRLRQAVDDAHLLIVGDGQQRPALERLAETLGVDSAVHFAGTLPDTRVALSLMRVFVFLPAQQEGFGLSLLEAMASGRPIVAVRRGGGAPWVLDQGGVGALVESDDPDRLSAAILGFLRNGEAACRAAGVARAFVKERYSLNRVVEQVELVYREALALRESIVHRP